MSPCYRAAGWHSVLSVTACWSRPRHGPPRKCSAAAQPMLAQHKKKERACLGLALAQTHPIREEMGYVNNRAYLAAVAFLAADCTSSVAFLTAFAASSCKSLPAAIIISTVSIWTFLAISAKAAMFSAATSALADAKSVIALA